MLFRSVFGLYLLFDTEIDQRGLVFISDKDDVAAATTITAVRSAFVNILFRTKTNTAVATAS